PRYGRGRCADCARPWCARPRGIDLRLLAVGVWRPHNNAPMPQGPNDEALRLLVDAVQDYAIFLLDTKGYIQTWNTGARRLKGYEASDIIGRHFSTFYTQPDLDADVSARELVDAERDGRVEDEGWRVRKDGSRFWANVVITAVRDHEGSVVGFAKVTRDLTYCEGVEEAPCR